jgi:L-fuconolactonase
MVAGLSSEFHRIDAHHHFWRVSRGDYYWMPADGPLSRDYLPKDMVDINQHAGITGTVLVQAAPTEGESEYLLGLADAVGSDQILGVVGWVDLEKHDDVAVERFANHPKFVGVRPMIQDISDDDWICRPAVIASLARLAALGLTFDLLCRPQHLSHAVRALERVPDLKVVVDHLAKPDYSRVEEVWQDNLTKLAERPNTYCKLAGLVSEVGPGWSIDDFRAHVEIVIELFGPDRIMIGTDWPVHLVVAKHSEVVNLIDLLISNQSEKDRRRMWSGTAVDVYGLKTLDE